MHHNVPSKSNYCLSVSSFSSLLHQDRRDLRYNLILFVICVGCTLHKTASSTWHFLEGHEPINNLAASESTGPDEVMAPDSKRQR